MTRAPTDSGGSLLRLLTGVVLIVAALTGATFGFLQLVRVLDANGYGSPAMRHALVILGCAGACLAGGVATLIWDIAKRYENPGTRH